MDIHFSFTVAAQALRYPTLHRHSRHLQTLEVFRRSLRPRGFLGLTLGLVTEMEAHLVFLVEITLEADISVCRRQFLFLNSFLSDLKTSDGMILTRTVAMRWTLRLFKRKACSSSTYVASGAALLYT